MSVHLLRDATCDACRQNFYHVATMKVEVGRLSAVHLCLKCAEAVVKVLAPYGYNLVNKHHAFHSSTDQQQTDYETPCKVCGVERQNHPWQCSACDAEMSDSRTNHDCVAYLKEQLKAARAATANAPVFAVVELPKVETYCMCGDAYSMHAPGGGACMASHPAGTLGGADLVNDCKCEQFKLRVTT